jgi:hypothetical protein
VEFTGVELAGGAELAARVEKVTTDLAQAITAPVEKVGHTLEKAVADKRRGRDGGRQAAAAGWRRDGDGGRRVTALGRGGDASQRALRCRGERRGGAKECGHGATEPKHLSVGSLLENRSIRVLETIRLLGR